MSLYEETALTPLWRQQGLLPSCSTLGEAGCTSDIGIHGPVLRRDINLPSLF